MTGTKMIRLSILAHDRATGDCTLPAKEDFTGFPDGTLKFLRELRKNNTKTWFDAHRSDYDNFYVAPAKSFVEAIGVRLKRIAPAIVAEPIINSSIFRINRNVRFSNDKRPYKDHLDVSFWEGEKKGSSSALFFRVSPDGVYIGAGHHSCKYLLNTFRNAIADPAAGEELASVVETIRKAGYELEGAHYKPMPRNCSDDGPAAEFLLHDGLYIVTEHEPQFATDDGLIGPCLKHWKAAMPLHRWLIDHVRA